VVLVENTRDLGNMNGKKLPIDVPWNESQNSVTPCIVIKATQPKKKTSRQGVPGDGLSNMNGERGPPKDPLQ